MNPYKSLKKKRIDFWKKNWTIYVIYISALANLAVNFIRPEVTTKSNPLASWQESRVASICSSGWCGEDQSIRIYLFSRAVTKKKKYSRSHPSAMRRVPRFFFFVLTGWRQYIVSAPGRVAWCSIDAAVDRSRTAIYRSAHYIDRCRRRRCKRRGAIVVFFFSFL